MAAILDENHLQQINEGITKAREGLAHIALAKMAGLDFSAQEAELNKSLDTLQRLKQVYFPGR